MASSNLGMSTLIWISVKPVIKIMVTGLIGAQLGKTGRLGSEGLKAVAEVQIIGALPCLMFSNLVPAITADNSKNIGICFGFGLYYMVLSYALVRLLSFFVVVPHHFKNGFIVAAVWSNWGNLPISVIQSLASEPPFGGVGDVDLGVAYGSFFTLLNNLSMFSGPGITLIQRDFFKKSDRDLHTVGHTRGSSTYFRDQSPIISSESAHDGIMVTEQEEVRVLPSSPASSIRSLSQNSVEVPLLGQSSLDEPSDYTHTEHEQTTLQRILTHLQPFLSPVTMAMTFGLIIAVTPPLKYLFVDPTDKGIHHPTTPDGKPILSVLIDATAYLGASAIPLAILVTGASFARMSLRGQRDQNLPIGAILGLAFMKLVILPIFGFGAVYGLDRFTNVFAEDQNGLLKMICIYYSCTVTSTNQISLTTLAAGLSGQESIDLLCAFIIVQYVMYPIVGTIVIATGIKMLF